MFLIFEETDGWIGLDWLLGLYVCVRVCMYVCMSGRVGSQTDEPPERSPFELCYLRYLLCHACFFLNRSFPERLCSFTESQSCGDDMCIYVAWPLYYNTYPM